MKEQLSMPLERADTKEHSESHGVCDGITVTREKDGTCRVTLDYGMPVEVLILEPEGKKQSVAGYQINQMIRNVLGKEPLPPLKPITIEVRGGVVQDVSNIPTGFEYEIIDHDDREEVTKEGEES